MPTPSPAPPLKPFVPRSLSYLRQAAERRDGRCGGIGITKRGYDYSSRYPLIVEALRRLNVALLVLDGEAMCLSKGREDFDKLCNRLHDPEAVLCAFDLLNWKAKTYDRCPLRDRKARLAKLLKKKEQARLQLVEHMEGDGPNIFEHACKLGLEGIVSKRLDRRYPARQHPVPFGGECDGAPCIPDLDFYVLSSSGRRRQVRAR